MISRVYMHGALAAARRRALQAEGPALDQRLVHGDRPTHADRLDRALDRQIGVVDGVVARQAEDLVRALLAVGRVHRRVVLRHRRSTCCGC